MKGFQLRGATSAPWFAAEHYDLEGKSALKPGWLDVQTAVKGVLAAHFRLKFHWESTEASGWMLVKAAEGTRLHEFRPRRDQGVGDGNNEVQTVYGIRGHKIAMNHLADYLTNLLQVTVVNQTDLKSFYDLTLDLPLDEWSGQERGRLLARMDQVLHDQLGLRLVERKLPVQIFAIDNVERAVWR